MLAIQKLHFKRFLSGNGPLPPDFMEQLQNLHENPSPVALEEFECSNVYSEGMQMYAEFVETSRSGRMVQLLNTG